MMLAHLIYRDKYRLSRTDVTFRDVVDLIYIIYGISDIDVCARIVAFDQVPEIVSVLNNYLLICSYCSSISITYTYDTVACKDNDHYA